MQKGATGPSYTYTGNIGFITTRKPVPKQQGGPHVGQKTAAMMTLTAFCCSMYSVKSAGLPGQPAILSMTSQTTVDAIQRVLQSPLHFFLLSSKELLPGEVQ